MKVFLKKNEERRIKSGHLWVFSNEIDKVEGDADNGDIVEVFDSRNNFLGSGFYNKNSLIAVRLLSSFHIDNFFFFAKEQILKAYDLRKLFYPNRDSFRLIFSESDFLPGLIIDKYNSTFVLQIYSSGIQKNIDIIVKILKEYFNAKNIFTKNDSYFRKLEGLPENDEIYSGKIEDEIIGDGLINYKINFEKGQKTGFFFDQSDNRFYIEKFAEDKTVLDAFCNAGGFGLHALKGGASSVTFVDSSSAEIESAKINYKLNDFNVPVDFILDDIFDYFKNNLQQTRKFDVVIIDPPAFTKSKKNLPAAKKGYEKLNKLALQTINENGILVTSSCSHHLDEKDFIQIINSAAQKVNKQLQLLYFNKASLDHPSLPSMPETSYLKFAIFSVTDK